MAELQRDLDLTVRSVHGDSTKRLLQSVHHATPTNEEPQENAKSCRASLNGESDNSENTATLRQFSQDNADPSPKQPQICSTQATLQPPPYAYWKGNPMYYLVWDALGIVISICFLGTLFRRS
jgi:hypothetical protein